MDKFIENLIKMGSSYGGKIVLAIVTLIVGLLVIKLIGKLIKKALGNSKLNDTVKLVIIKTVKIILYVVLIVGIVSILGVPMSSVVAIIASCGLAVGLAFQGALANLAGGLMILIFHPFKVGDYVQATGAEGVVTDISIFYTKLLTLDNKRVLVPNGDLMNANITNLTAENKRRIDQDFKITNDIDQDLVRSVLMAAAKATEGVMEEPAPFARLTAVDDDTYIFTVRAWCDTAKYWDVYFDLIENCSSALAANGIDDPEERIAVRLVKDEDDNEKAAE
ncbi:MAG: mechanosensitive ion channel family protein [Clostridia bacterium]|nr:mechanosensitive ion channel family protein [Clostridia bacterium]